MILDDTFLNRKGLLRCCGVTLLQLAESDPAHDYGNGAIVKCKLSKGQRSHTLMLWNGTWRWVDPQTVEGEEREKLRSAGLLWDHVRGRIRD